MSDGSLATYYKGWDHYQDLLVAAVAPLTSEQLALRAAPNQRNVWTIAAHIIAARVWWFHSIMGEGDARLEQLQTWDDDGQPQRSAAELEEGLERTWAMIQACLKRWTAADFGQHFIRRGESLSRQWIIWHVVEHDLNHGGELFLTLGLHGLPTPDL
jgi:uncharacterized damage-inducible protein DinB